MDSKLSEATFESKKKVTIPPDAVITKKSYRLTVEEIENGFILSKSYDIEYTNAAGENKHEYYTKKWHTMENPMTIKEVTIPEKTLAEKLD